MAIFNCDYCGAKFNRKPSQIRTIKKYCSRTCQVNVRKLDFTGQRFGRLLVIGGRHNIRGHAYWSCQCDCGNTEIVGSSNLKQCTRSCGCLSSETTRERNRTTTKHGHTHKINGKIQISRTYYSWRAMLTRCGYEKHPAYELYGGRGIAVCDRWLGEHGFENFLSDMGERPKGLTLDRYPDNNGNYEPGNCRWATHREQMNNTRSTLTVLIGETQIPIKRYSEAIGMAHSKFYRLHKTRGLSIREIMAQEKLFYRCAG